MESFILEPKPPMPELTALSTDDEKVSIWQVLNGRITEILIMGDIFVVKPDVPKSLDPVKAAQDFLKIFDVKKTAMIRKVKPLPAEAEAVIQTKKQTKRTRAIDGTKLRLSMEEVGRVSNITIYKEVVIKIYKKAPTSFRLLDVTKVLLEIYPNNSEVSAHNKARGYATWLTENGYLEKRSEKGNGKTHRKVYSFLKAPFGAERPAQAEVDPEEIQKRKELELVTMRKTL